MATKKRRNKGGGLGRVQEAASRKGKGKAEWLKLEDGDVVFVRVVGPWEDAYCHRVQMELDNGKTYYADVPCLDQDDKGKPCPGCAEDLDRRYKFWTNVIIRGDEDADDAAERKDRLAIWGSGITIGKRLDKLDKRFGIKNRDLEVEREGSTMKDTKYDIEPATDEDEELTEDDEALIKNLFDLSRYSKPPSFDDFFKNPGDRDKDDDDDEDPGKASLRRGSAFKNRKNKDDDEEDDRPARRSSSKKGKKKSGSLGAMKAKKDADAKKPSNTTVRKRRTR